MFRANWKSAHVKRVPADVHFFTKAAAVAPDRAQRLLWLAALALVYSTARGAQAADVTPAYVARGRETEVRQHAYHDRIERFYQTLSEHLRDAAPGLLATLAAPPADVHGYQILPRVVADPAPPAPGTTAGIVSFSWRWSDTLIEREMAGLERLETGLAQVPPGAGRPRDEKLAADYRAAIARRRRIDANIQYNWLWQAHIDRDRPLFDRLKTVQEAVLERQAIEAAIASHDEAALRRATAGRELDPTASAESLSAALAGRAQALARQIAAATRRAAPPDFARIEHPASGVRLVHVPLYTDITDAAFVEAFRKAVETLWRARMGGDEFRVHLAIETIPPEQLYCGRAAAPIEPERCAPPTRGAAVDLETHVARFPNGGAVLTTGATTLQLIANRAIVLGPHNVAPHVLAHEFGHVLGFPDTYRRGYRDLGADGYQITELVDRGDIMGAPGTGPVLARHFEELVAAMEVQAAMRAGLAALYQRNDPAAAVARFREVLARNPTHYGATLQLAKALDRSGRPDEALEAWKKILAMAEAVSDADTIGAAQARIGSR